MIPTAIGIVGAAILLVSDDWQAVAWSTGAVCAVAAPAALLAKVGVVRALDYAAWHVHCAAEALDAAQCRWSAERAKWDAIKRRGERCR